jgi:hypothetical protein
MHTNIGVAMSAHKRGLRMMSQNALRFYKRLGYHAYEGIVEDSIERDPLVAALGPHNIPRGLKPLRRDACSGEASTA